MVVDPHTDLAMQENTMKRVKQFRYEIQAIVDRINSLPGRSREQSLAITKLEEGKMWLGKLLGALGSEDLNAKRDAVEVE